MIVWCVECWLIVVVRCLVVGMFSVWFTCGGMGWCLVVGITYSMIIDFDWGLLCLCCFGWLLFGFVTISCLFRLCGCLDLVFVDCGFACLGSLRLRLFGFLIVLLLFLFFVDLVVDWIWLLLVIVVWVMFMCGKILLNCVIDVSLVWVTWFKVFGC